jgi:translocation and assembly module TamB
MSRARKIALWIAGGMTALTLVATIGVIITVRTQWFRDFVRAKIVTSVEEATGGKVDLGSFAFTWTHLRADVQDFVVHGLEPAGSAPLLRVKHLQVELKLLSPLKGFVELAYLLVDTPQANLMVFPDGRTNIPEPKIKKKPSDKSPLETIVELAIGKFDLLNATASFADTPAAINASGQNLRIHLSYNTLHPSYTGEVDILPLYVRSGTNTPVNANVKLPISMDKDKVTLTNATVETPTSKIALSAEVNDMNHPHMSGHLNGQISIDEVRRAAGLTIPLDLAHGPQFVNADVTAAADEQSVHIQSARVTLGGSSIEAKGTLKQQNKPGNVQFNATLALNELGRMLKVAARPEGIVKAGGNASLDANNNWSVTGNVDGRGIGFHQGTMHVAGAAIDTSVTADPHRIELAGLRLAALGGGFTGNATIEEMQHFRAAGNLHNFDIDQMARAFTGKGYGYDGIVSGPVQVDGDLKNPAALVAKANLGIAPGRRGIPVSGKLNVDYNGRADTVMLAQSYLQLPHTRVDLSGSLGKQIQARVVSHDFADFKPLGNIPVTLNGEAATVTATVSGKLSAPRVTAHAEVTRFTVEGRTFDRFAADVTASANGAAATNAVLTRGALAANFSGSVGLRNWKPENFEPLKVDATVRNADLADVLALAGQSSVQATGTLAADAHVAGTVGSPTGDAVLSVANGTIEGEAFDSLNARAVMTPQAIDVPTLALVAGPSRIDATAHYDHPVNDLSRGSVRAHVASNQVQLAQFQPLVKERPGLRGILSLNGDFAGNVVPTKTGTEVQIANLNTNLSVRGLQMEGKNLGDLTATATSSGNTIDYNVNSDFAGSTIHVTGRSALTGAHETTATAQISNLPIDSVLLVAGQRDLPVTGTLSASGQVSGTLDDPRAIVALTVVKGSAYNEPFDRLQTNLSYSNTAIDVPNFRVDLGPSYVIANANFTHPAGDFEDGQVRFKVNSNQIELAKLHTVQEARPGLAGALQLAAEGAATLRKGAGPLFSTLNANVNARGISVDKAQLGDLTATATTRGQAVAFDLRSDLAHSDIHGTGTMELTGDYPVNAQVTFANVTYSGLRPLLGGQAQPFDGSANGSMTIAGPVTNTDALRATVTVAKLEAHSIQAQTGRKPRVNFELHNEAPIVVALDRGVVNVQSAHIVGPFTDVSVTGTANITGTKAVNLRANGNVKLEVLQAFSPDIFSSGGIVLNATVAGTTDNPSVNGRLQLQNASVNLLDVPNGLTNGNGTVTFSGTQAIIENITGETGGGKVTLTGFVAYGGPEMRFRVNANADKIRVEQGEISVQVSAQMVAAGQTSRSLISGNVTIQDVAMHSHTDIGSMLASAATPPPATTASTGLLAGVRFDVKIQTAPDVQFRTTLTQNLQADANLTLRGTLDHPGMLGRVVVTQGDVVFFGAKYTIDQGTLNFYNPNRINPVMNIDLETTVQGVDVSISVTGPMDKMKMSYRSDPPMQFSDLVSLLASGKPPTSDPVLAARAPAAPQQNFEQAGASAVLSQAVANPVSGRLQRLFGVSKLKIDPQITGASNTALATMTLQQQISRQITFTYIQDVTQSNPQIIRMEWAIDPHWSAIAQRDRNGMFDLDFFFKKRFH